MKKRTLSLLVVCLTLVSCQEHFNINIPKSPDGPIGPIVESGPRFDFSSLEIEPARNFEADVRPSVKAVGAFIEGTTVKLFRDSSCAEEIASHLVTAGEANTGEIILTSSERLPSGTYYFSLKDSNASNCEVVPDSFQVQPFSPIKKVVINTQSGVLYRYNKTMTFWDNEIHDPSGNAFTPFPASASTQVEEVVANGMAYAALKTDGSVVTWGFDDWGGNSSTVAAQLTSNVVKIIPASGGSFAALKSDGSVIMWGLSYYGVSMSPAQAAALSSGVVKVLSNGSSFVALKSNKSVVTWGWPTTGGDSSAVAANLLSNVEDIFATENAGTMGAIKSDGSMVVWGHRYGDLWACPGVSTEMNSNVEKIFFSTDTFAAIRSGGQVITCGDSNYGGDSSAASLASGVINIYKTNAAFAALKIDGTVQTWGQGAFGGNSSSVSAQLTGVTKIYSNNVSFAALKSDGSVVSWGMYSPTPLFTSTYLSSGVVSITNTQSAFAALKSDGSVVTWGDSGMGADSSAVATFLQSGVVNVEATIQKFVAYKADGSIVSW